MLFASSFSQRRTLKYRVIELLPRGRCSNGLLGSSGAVDTGPVLRLPDRQLTALLPVSGKIEAPALCLPCVQVLWPPSAPRMKISAPISGPSLHLYTPVGPRLAPRAFASYNSLFSPSSFCPISIRTPWNHRALVLLSAYYVWAVPRALFCFMAMNSFTPHSSHIRQVRLLSPLTDEKAEVQRG